mmetsp:Transcript_89201/g.193090  ORF Transcript_89201/g.193090 Transcript_89201/m.193090 type:complete len:254 (-) Transcript_89201:114-875(-)
MADLYAMSRCVGMFTNLSPRSTSLRLSRSSHSPCRLQNMRRGIREQKRSSDFSVLTPVARKASATRPALPGASAGSETASSSSAMPARSSRESDLHWPKSMRPTRPSGRSRMFPGCGSPLKNGQKKSWKPWTSRTSCSVLLRSSVATSLSEEGRLAKYNRMSAHARTARRMRSIPNSRSATWRIVAPRPPTGDAPAPSPSPGGRAPGSGTGCEPSSLPRPPSCCCFAVAHSDRDLPRRSTPRASSRRRSTSSS